ncbi:MAG: efflux RND transporter periplasmic adaptor subunit [Alphaproteobacteria bacterium]|nr:efflux RND transporter periplasmic adaptor subunit [Alphaproteobacteria bacterium]
MIRIFKLVLLVLSITIGTASAPAVADDGGKGKVLFYRAPMSSDVSPTPKKDEMGMDYIPVYESDAKEKVGTVKLSAERIQKLGVRTEAVERRDITHPVHALGTIQIDETRQTVIAPRFEGWIQKLSVNATGQKVKKGDVLFDFYSPQLLQIENEYLVSRSDMPAMKNSGGSLEKLRTLAVSEEEIQRLQRDKTASNSIAIRAPADGTVMEKTAIEGMKFSAGDTLYRLADLGNVWVVANVFEHDLSSIVVGQPVKVTIHAYEGKFFEGKVEFIYPDLNKDTRAAKVRIELPNADELFRKDMFVDATIDVKETDHVLAVPVSAVLNSGKRQSVLVDLGDGKFQPQSVKTGKRGGDYVEILDGLKEGDRVVTSANFLIDSESNLRAALQSFTAPEVKP